MLVESIQACERGEYLGKNARAWARDNKNGDANEKSINDNKNKI